MNDFRNVFFIIGLLLATMTVGMLLPAFIDIISHNSEGYVFVASACITGFIAGILILTNRGEKITVLTTKQAFALTAWSWIVMAAFSALPFYFSMLNLTYTDSFFEAMSGLTTTGATVIIYLEEVPLGLLLWRGLLQWFGGIGIIVMAIAILPMLKVGGMQLFRLESSDNSEKIHPHTAKIAGSITKIYVFISLICALCYWLAGMTPFEAIIHSMTTISTGGFSTSDESMGFFQNSNIYWVAICFMILSSLPFVVYLQFLYNKSHKIRIVDDTQIRGFISILVSLVVILCLYRFFTTHLSAGVIFEETVFNVTSVMTGTGYVTANYNLWGHFAVNLLFVVIFIGGCAGSTSCGLKIFRLQVVWQSILLYMRRIIFPNSVSIVRYNNRVLSEEVMGSVIIFVATYFICFACIAILLNILGLDTITSLSAAAASIANVGPGLGEIIGPQGHYGSLSYATKWVLCVAMLLGRLELFTILVLFTPHFWRK